MGQTEKAELAEVREAWLEAESREPTVPAEWTVVRELDLDCQEAKEVALEGCGVIRQMRVAVWPPTPVNTFALARVQPKPLAKLPTNREKDRMKNYLLLSLLLAAAIGCGKSSPPAESDRLAAPATQPSIVEPVVHEQDRGAADRVVSQTLETVADTAHATVVEVREQAEAVVAEAQERMAEAQEQARAVVADAQNQAQAVVVEMQQQAQTVVTQFPPQLEQMSTQAQSQLQAIASKTLDLSAPEPRVSTNAPGHLGIEADAEKAVVAATDTNQPATSQTNAVSRLETNVVTTVTNVVQETRKALNRLFAPRRGASQ